ncbi:MAG: hypothetical protein KIS66_02500 [Fimbriimonadaceae bacterium]|nr:hypothetical protein [Fimbriimonadaceae bacterium]
MALHQDKRGVFIHAANGQLSRGRREAREAFRAVDGVLVSLSLHRSEWNGRERTELWIELLDGEDRYLVTSRHPTTFSYMFARHLRALKAGDRVRLDVWLVEGQERVTGAKVSTLGADGDWVPVPNEAKHPAPPTREERLRAANVWILDHVAFRPTETSASPEDAIAGEIALYGYAFRRPLPEALRDPLGPERVSLYRREATRLGGWDPLVFGRTVAARLGEPTPTSLETTPRKLAALALSVMAASDREGFDRDALVADYEAMAREVPTAVLDEYDPFEGE